MEYIAKTVSRIAALLSTRDDYKYANIGDLNRIVDQFNNVFPYRLYDIDITQEGTTAPVSRVVGAGIAKCNRTCGSDCKLCDCTATCNNGEINVFSANFVYISPGVYDLTITLNPTVYPRAIRNVGFFPGSHDPSVNVFFEKQLSKNLHVAKYRITAKNEINMPSNNILNKYVLAMKIYF